MPWSVYLLVSGRSGATYVGVSTDAERRLAQHNGERPGGAKCTRGGRPWTIERVWGPYPDRSAAQRAEHEVKRLRGPERRLGPAPDPAPDEAPEPSPAPKDVTPARVPRIRAPRTRPSGA